ncbi:hypothetical protein ACH4T9_25655 [Micromonospora sp. NPDC020750]|uniref:hypothetical protein n=1 Tax=Micromonospora sp. NPDC020750 TaxID=3364239 RepID=UPI0037AE53B0
MVAPTFFVDGLPLVPGPGFFVGFGAGFGLSAVVSSWVVQFTRHRSELVNSIRAGAFCTYGLVVAATRAAGRLVRTGPDRSSSQVEQVGPDQVCGGGQVRHPWPGRASAGNNDVPGDNSVWHTVWCEAW